MASQSIGKPRLLRISKRGNGYLRMLLEAQLEVQSLHRVRGRLVAERTAIINQLRALLLPGSSIRFENKRDNDD